MEGSLITSMERVNVSPLTCNLTPYFPGVTIGPVYDISQIVQDDYVLEREALIEIPDAEMGHLPTHPVVPRLCGTPGALKSPAPRLGEHNEALLRPLLGADEYDRLRQSGVIK